LPIVASNAALRWLTEEAAQASGLEAYPTLPDDIDFDRESVVRVTRAHGRVVYATPREIQWSEGYYRAVAISRDLDVARQAQEAIEAALQHVWEVPGPDGTVIHFCKSVDEIALEEIEGSAKIYHRGVEFAVKVRPAS
jgi:hypothetical protein